MTGPELMRRSNRGGGGDDAPASAFGVRCGAPFCIRFLPHAILRPAPAMDPDRRSPPAIKRRQTHSRPRTPVGFSLILAPYCISDPHPIVYLDVSLSSSRVRRPHPRVSRPSAANAPARTHPLPPKLPHAPTHRGARPRACASLSRSAIGLPSRSFHFLLFAPLIALFFILSFFSLLLSTLLTRIAGEEGEREGKRWVGRLRGVGICCRESFVANVFCAARALRFEPSSSVCVASVSLARRVESCRVA